MLWPEEGSGEASSNQTLTHTHTRTHHDFWSSAARTVFAMYKKNLNKSIVSLFFFKKKQYVCGLLLTKGLQPVF